MKVWCHFMLAHLISLWEMYPKYRSPVPVHYPLRAPGKQLKPLPSNVVPEEGRNIQQVFHQLKLLDYKSKRTVNWQNSCSKSATSSSSSPKRTGVIGLHGGPDQVRYVRWLKRIPDLGLYCTSFPQWFRDRYLRHPIAKQAIK